MIIQNHRRQQSGKTDQSRQTTPLLASDIVSVSSFGGIKMNSKDNRGSSDIGKLIKIILFAAILLFGAKYAYENYIKVIDVTNDLKMTEAQLANKYGTTFSDNPSMAKQVPQYSNPQTTTITVRSDGTYDVIYANGRQIGVGTGGKRCQAYHVRWGYNEKDVNEKLAFQYEEEPSEVLNDMAEGHSTATFYVKGSTNEGIVFVRNNTTNCVIYILYYSNIHKAMETLESVF